MTFKCGIKRRLIAAYEGDEDYVLTARLLNVSRQAAWQLVRRFLNDGQVVRPRGGARAQVTLADEEMMAVAVDIVTDHPAYTLRQINDDLRQRLPNKPQVSVATVARMLEGQLIRVKKLEDAPVNQNAQHTLNARHEYVTWMTQQGVNKTLIFVDEAGKYVIHTFFVKVHAIAFISGFNLHTRRTRGRAAVGERAVRQVAGCNLNIIMAISPGVGVVYKEVHLGTVNTEIFGVFLDNLGDIVSEEQEATVVMDNAPVHNNAFMRHACHEIVKLPPYSPMLNPIEMAFLTVKAYVKQDLNNRMDEILNRAIPLQRGLTLTAYRAELLREVVQTRLEGSAVITAERCDNWHRHTFTYWGRCLNREPISM